jgi:ATP-dependent Clp endopeptidase proteolytic subunit ClpP
MFEVKVRNPGLTKVDIPDSGDLAVKYKSPHIIYVNKFTEDSAKDFLEGMINAQNTGQEIVPVIIDSYGGEVYSLLKMVDVIKASKMTVATICMGKAMSCGAVLLACGAEGHRYMAPTGTVMIHDVASAAMGKVEEIKAEAKEVDRLNKIIFKMMAIGAGQPADYFSKLVHENGHADLFLDAEEAKKHGLVNHIKLPKIEVTFDVQMTFG